MLLEEPKVTEFLHKSCISIGYLYGGSKDQRQNFVFVPKGSSGIIICRTSNRFGVDYYLVKFTVPRYKNKHVFVKCHIDRVKICKPD